MVAKKHFEGLCDCGKTNGHRGRCKGPLSPEVKAKHMATMAKTKEKLREKQHA